MCKFKKVISVLTAVVMAVTVNLSTAAEAISEPELTNIHGYMCYERDGEYWTMLDGVEYLVLDLDTFMPVESDEVVAKRISKGKPAGWTNDRVVNLTASKPSYEDFCDLSKGNYCSPVYEFDPTGALCSAEISTKVLLSQTYDVNIYTYQGAGLSWISEKHTFTFNMFQPRHLLFTGTAGHIITGLALEFLSSSTGQKDLYYTITVTGDLKE